MGSPCPSSPEPRKRPAWTSSWTARGDPPSVPSPDWPPAYLSRRHFAVVTGVGDPWVRVVDPVTGVTSEVAVTHQTSLFSIWSDCLITVAAA